MQNLSGPEGSSRGVMFLYPAPFIFYDIPVNVISCCGWQDNKKPFAPMEVPQAVSSEPRGNRMEGCDGYKKV